MALRQLLLQQQQQQQQGQCGTRRCRNFHDRRMQFMCAAELPPLVAAFVQSVKAQAAYANYLLFVVYTHTRTHAHTPNHIPNHIQIHIRIRIHTHKHKQTGAGSASRVRLMSCCLHTLRILNAFHLCNTAPPAATVTVY